MPSTLTTPLRPRLPLPDTIERGRSNTLTCPLYLSGALTAPASGTVSIYDASGIVQVEDAAVTIAASIATYTWTPSADLALGRGWVVVWTLVVSGATYIFRNDAQLVRCRPSCPIVPQDLYRLAPALDPAGADPVTAASAADHDGLIEEAWVEVQGRLLADDRRPWLVIGNHALRDVTLLTALAAVFASLSHRQREVYGETARDYRKQAEDAWSRVRLTYDQTDIGTPDPGGRGGRSSVIWFGR